MIRRMQAGDLPSCLRLTQAENWSHRIEDWELHYRLGRGWVACDADGQVVGTILWWAYGERFGTIGLVVVDRGQQGKGIGRKLMDAAINDAGPRTLQLVATAAGLKLYRQCGFEERGHIDQRQGIPHLPEPIAAPGNAHLRPITPLDIEKLCGMDSAAFGAPRHHLIEALTTAATGVVAEGSSGPAGFALLRRAGRGPHIGPIVADSERMAISLVSSLLANAGGFARVDVPAEAVELGAWLDEAGLVRVDRVTTMVRGERPAPHSALRTFGLVSQAFS